MNSQPQDDKTWQALLAHSAPTFTGETTPPFGFVTSTLTKLRAEKGEKELLEKIGLRALFASLCVLIAVTGFSAGLQMRDRFDIDPGLRSIISVDRVTIA